MKYCNQETHGNHEMARKKERKNKWQTEDEKFHPFNCVNLQAPHLDKGNFKTELEAKSIFEYNPPA